MYVDPIIDINGHKKHVIAYGIEKITDINNKILSSIFPGIDIGSVSRPIGEVDRRLRIKRS